VIDLIVISCENDFLDEINLVKQMMEDGLRRFHLRKPHWTEEAYVKYIDAFDTIEKERIVVHQYHEASKANGVRHLHLRSSLLTTTPLNTYKHYTSTSFHTREDLEQYGANFDYTFLSPIFDSISKPGYTSSAALLNTPINSRQQVYAMGGITPSRLKMLNGLGFKGVAALGYIWQGDPIENYKTLNQLCCAQTF